MSSSKCSPPAILHILLLWCRIGLTVVIATNVPPSPVRNLTCFSRSPTYGYCIWNNSDTLIKPTPSHTLERTLTTRDNDWKIAPCEEPPEGVDINADNICYLEGPDDTRYRYRVVSSNELGSVVANMTTPDTFSMYYDVVPYPPHDINLQAETSASLHVTWHPPSEFAGGMHCRILGYKIRHKNSKDSDWIDGLKFTRQMNVQDICEPVYTIPVRYPPYSIVCIQLATEPFLANVNRQTADKVWSEWSQIKCTRLLEEEPNKEPGELKSIISKNEENRQLINVLLTWEPLPVDSQNGKILGYNIGVTGRLDSHVTSNRTTYSAPENATQLFIADLNRIFQYTIDIVAFNSAGRSPKATINIQPFPIKAPESEPANFTEVRFKNERSRTLINVHLSWKPVPENKQTDTILGYNITVNGHIDSNTKYWSTYLVQENATDFIITDLNKTYFYAIDIVAFNEGGNSPKATIIIEPAPIKNNMLTMSTVVVSVLLVAVILLIVFFYFWRKLSQQQEFEVQLPSIVKRSNYYTNTLHTSFRIQEPEQFDELSERRNSPCCIDISENEINFESHVAVNVYQNFLGDLVESAEFNHVVEGITCDDVVEETNNSESVCVDHNGLGSGEIEGDEEICYLSMTPQGLSPLRKCTENHSDDGSDSNVVNETPSFTMMVLNGSDVSDFKTSLPGTLEFGSTKSCGGCSTIGYQDFGSLLNAKPSPLDAEGKFRPKELIPGEIPPYVKQGIIPIHSQKNCNEPEAAIETGIVKNPKIATDNNAKINHLNQILIPYKKIPENNAKPGRTSGYVMHNHLTEVSAMSTAAKQLQNVLLKLNEEKPSKEQDKVIECNLTTFNHMSQIVDDGGCCTDKEGSIVFEQNEVKSMFNTNVDHPDLKDETSCNLDVDSNLVELKMSTEEQTEDNNIAFSEASGISPDLLADGCLHNSVAGLSEQSTFEKDQLCSMGFCHDKPVERFKNGEQPESTDSGIDIPNILFCDGDIIPNRTAIDLGEVNSRIELNLDSTGVTMNTDECQANSNKDDSNHYNTQSCHNNLQSVNYPCDSNTGYLHLATLKAANGLPPSIKTPDDGYSSSSNSSAPDSPTEVLPNKMSG